jgi:hypothetical protein
MKLGCLFGSKQGVRVNCPLAMKCSAVDADGLSGSYTLNMHVVRGGREILQWRSEK